MKKKQSSITHIRSWVRTNGEMSEDGKSITYSCAELEAVIREAEAMHKEEIKDAWLDGEWWDSEKDGEQYYNETFGGTTGGIGVDKISWTNTSGTNHLSHINPLTDKLTNMEVTMSEQNSVVTLIQENESVIKVNKECERGCGNRVTKYDKFTEEEYCENCGWS